MFDFLFLFKREKEGELPKLVSKYPEDVEFLEEEFQYIIPNSIPKKFEKSDIYMFSTTFHSYYDYSFNLKGIDFSIIIVSSHFHPSLFIDFLRSIDNSFDVINPTGKNESDSLQSEKNDKIDSEAYIRFIYVQSLLNSWFSTDEGDLVVNYPFDSYRITLSPDLNVYSASYKQNTNINNYYNSDAKRFCEVQNKLNDIKAQDEAIEALHSWTDVFDVAPLMPHVEAIWSAAIQSKGVMIVAPTASIASCSAISVLSILEPMKYAEPCLIFSQIGDPRFTPETLAPNIQKCTKSETTLRSHSNDQISSTNHQDDLNLNSNPRKNSFNSSNQLLNLLNIKAKLIQDNSCDDDDESNQTNISKFRIVATTYDSYVQLVHMISDKTALSESQSIGLLNQNFSAIITIKATQFRPLPKVKKVYAKKTKLILKKFLSLMNFILLSDPYFDLLGKQIDENQLIYLWPNDGIITASTIANISEAFNKKKSSKSEKLKSNKNLNDKNTNDGDEDKLPKNDNGNENRNENENDNRNENENVNRNENENDNRNENENENTQKRNENEQHKSQAYSFGDNNTQNDNKNERNSGSVSSYSNDKNEQNIIELIKFYKNIQKTTTFKKWRYVREDRDQLRVGFLSVSPTEAVSKIPDEKLQQAYEKVKLLINVHQKDEHFRIVLHRNLSLIKKRLNKSIKSA